MSSGARIAETPPPAASPGGREAASSRADGQDTPWMSAFSVVSRPALSLLHKYLPGVLPARSLTAAMPEWADGDLHRAVFSGHGLSYAGQPVDVRHSAGQRDDPGPGLLEHRAGPHLTWLTADPLSELGIKPVGDIEKQHIMGDVSSVRDLGTQVLLKATLPTEAPGAPLRGGCGGPAWWGVLWGDSSPRRLSALLSLGQANGLRAAHCSPLRAGTKASVARTTALFVQFSSWESTAGEHAGPSGNTQHPADNGSPQSTRHQAPGCPRCSGALVPQQGPRPGGSNVGPGAAAVFGEVAVLTPDQDNGYSSLEEGYALCHPHTVKVIAEVELRVAGHIAILETEPSEPTEWVSPAAEGMEKEGAGEGSCGGEEEEEEEEDGGSGGADETSTQEASSAPADVLTSPYCQNRAIAFIMGSPCSDDDEDNDDDDADSLSDGECSDDGFDSECSSETSDSDSDDSTDSEADRLWNSLRQNQDPYNPLNFTAPMITGPKPVPSISTTAACSSDSSPDQGSPPKGSLSLTGSPPSVQHPDSPWDDSTSASEAEDTDNQFLWNSFLSPSDPYSLQNFQAPVRTQRLLPEVQVAKGKKRSLKASLRGSHHGAAASSPPQYQREGAEDRLDSGFSEALAPVAPAVDVVPSQSCVLKKVRFCDEVEEFVTSSREEEDRRGQWEELARDRCRFARRCQEAEKSIAYCLEPRHRVLVYRRLHS